MKRSDFLKLIGMTSVAPICWDISAKDDGRKPAWFCVGERQFRMLITDEEMEWLNKYFDDPAAP